MTTAYATTDEQLYTGLINSPDFITVTTPEEIAAALGITAEPAEQALPAEGEKITFTGTIIYAESSQYRPWTKAGHYVVIKDDETGISYTFNTTVNLAKQVGKPEEGHLARGNRTTITATVKSVGEYKGAPSIKVTRPRMEALEYGPRYRHLTGGN